MLDIKVREYKERLDIKDSLAQQTKENNAKLEALEQEICQMMIDEEKPSTIVDGYNYSLQEKIMYSKKSEADLFKLEQEEGVIFFEALREQGLGDLIVEKVDPRTLQSTMKHLVEDEGGIPEDLEKCLNIYEKLSLSKRKANVTALNRAKKNN